jgi:ASPIC and UnbV/FG-GAP-like repeat
VADSTRITARRSPVGRLASSLLTGVVCIAGTLAGGGPAWGQSDDSFAQRAFPASTSTFDDLGVVDYEGDGDLDVFTTNHLTTQLLLANDGSGSFEDRLTAARLNQTPAFPGWEDKAPPPNRAAPGLYVYRSDGVVLTTVGEGQAVSGELRFLTPVKVRDRSGATATLARRGSAGRVARFSMAGDSTVRLDPKSAALPVEVTIDPPFSLSRVFVGPRRISPTSHRFALQVRDRHGMAWADYNHDGHLDAFITRGGVSGKIGRYRGVVQDELQLGEGATFHNGLAGSGIGKGTCRGRAAAAVDYNRDGLLDIFAACFKASPKLYRQRANGRFRDVSRPLRKSQVEGTAFAWVDVNGRGEQELLAARRGSFAVYRPRKAGWRRAQTIRGRHDGPVNKLALADYDNDGDPDVFAASKSGSTLLVNRRGRLRPKKPKSIGLPSRSLTANWVDYDNDGRVDIHVVRGGLYAQGRTGRFSRTGRARAGGGAEKATAAWFDADGDGSRDAALAVQHRGPGKVASLSLLENIGPVGHWLEVELTGPPGNRQAIGARVSAAVHGETQTQWVGQNDGSHLSQGHYRLYFGLGGATSASVKVTWPNGSVRSLGSVTADRILRVSQGK